MTETNLNPDLDNIFEALGNKHRREIVYSLSLQPSSITRLARQRKLSLPAIHKHIKQLELAHLLQRKKIGRTNFLAIDRKGLQSLQQWITQFNPYWGHNSETLENYTHYMKGGDKK